MISLTRSLSDLDRLEQLQKTSLECYRLAVESAGRYLVETDREVTRQHREQLEAIAKQVAATEAPKELRQAQRSFQDEQEAYAGIATRYVRVLKDKVTATARALTEIAAKPPSTETVPANSNSKQVSNN